MRGQGGKTAWQNYARAVSKWSAEVTRCVEEGLNVPAAPVSPGPKGHNEPCSIYNAMVHPLVGYGVRGAIWYQGESNSGDGIQYLPKLKALVDSEADRVLSELRPGAVASVFGWAWKPVVRRWVTDRTMAALRGAR